MQAILWENRQLQILRADGTITCAIVAFKEPEGIDYYWQIGRQGRGTMYGNSAFLETRDIFYGAVHYQNVIMVSEGATVAPLRDVMAIRKFQKFFTPGRKCAIYLLSPKEGVAGHTMVFAVRSADEQEHDIEGICSMAGHLETSLDRQLRRVVILAGISLFCFFIMALSLLAPFFGIHGVIILFLLFVAFFAGSLLAGRVIIKEKLKVFPSRPVFEQVLRMDGWRLS